MKKLLFLLFFSLYSLFCEAQEVIITATDSIQFPKNSYKRFLAVDNYNGIYFLNFEVLTKIQGDQKWVYTNYELGVPTSVSTLNPLQILVFYKETNTIVFLDRFLNETRRVDLNQLNPPKIGWWAENTKNQEIWLYSGEDNHLEFFNYKQNITLSQTIPFLETPIGLTADFNNAYVLFQHKINQYNIYGTLLHTKTIDSLQQLKISKSYILGKSKHQLKVFDRNLKTLGTIKIPKNNLTDFSLRDEKLYIYSESTLFTYQLTFTPN